MSDSQQERPRVSFDALSQALGLLQRHWGLWALFVLLVGVIQGVINFAVSIPFAMSALEEIRASGQADDPFAIYSTNAFRIQMVVAAIAGAFAYPLTATLTRCGLRVLRGEFLRVEWLFDFNGKYLNLVGYSVLLNFLLSVPYLFITDWVLVVVYVVAMLFVYPLLQPAKLLILEQRMGAVGAITRSASASAPFALTLFALYLVSGIVAAAGIIACFIGILFTMPIIYLVDACVYAQLFGTGTQDRVMAGAPPAVGWHEPPRGDEPPPTVPTDSSK